MGYYQEAYDAECAALATAQNTAGRQNSTPEGATLFTAAAAAIKRMASEVPGQMYAIQAGKHIAALRRTRPRTIEIRWCPAHKGALERRRPASEGRTSRCRCLTPVTRRAAYQRYSDQPGARPVPLPRSLAHCGIFRTKARRWAAGRATGKKYKLPSNPRPDGTSDLSIVLQFNQFYSDFYQLVIISAVSLPDFTPTVG